MIQTDTRKLPCPICANGTGPCRYDTSTLANHLQDFHRRYDAWSLVELAIEIVERRSGWAVTIEALTAIDAGFTGTEDEDSLIVWHDHEWIGRYSRNASLVCLIADARRHMAEQHGVALPYSVPATAGGV
jgi:hypothetical protein